jgi:hypothetical protein
MLPVNILGSNITIRLLIFLANLTLSLSLDHKSNPLKNAVFLDVTPCDSCKNRRFGGIYFLHPQDEKN